MREVIAYNEDIELPTWHTEDDKPKIDHLVTVKSEDGCEERNYIWDGEEWLQVEYGQGLNGSVEYTTDFQV